MKNEVKLIALDLDRTLLYDRQFANKNDLEEIKRLQDEGYLITLATGQSYDTASVFAKEIGIDRYVNKIICQNGAYITTVDEFKPEQVAVIKSEITQGLLEYFIQLKAKVVFLKYNDLNNYYSLDSDLSILGSEVNDDTVVTLIDKNTNLDGVSFIWIRVPADEDEPYLETIEARYPHQLEVNSAFTDDMKGMDVMISDLHANKGERLLALAQELNLHPNEILAFGDGGNDVTMFKRVKYSVAMGNARQSVKDQALYTTQTCLEGGVSNFLKKYF